MNKSELVEALITEKKYSLPPEQAQLLVDVFLDEIADALASGRRVEIRGFGAFSVRAKRERKGRNPKTGESIMIGEKHFPHFKPGKNLRERCDEHESGPDYPITYDLAAK